MDDFEDILKNLETPLHVTLVWDEDGDEWELTSNAADQKEIVAALSHTLFLMACGELIYSP